MGRSTRRRPNLVNTFQRITRLTAQNRTTTNVCEKAPSEGKANMDIDASTSVNISSIIHYNIQNACHRCDEYQQWCLATLSKWWWQGCIDYEGASEEIECILTQIRKWYIITKHLSQTVTEVVQYISLQRIPTISKCTHCCAFTSTTITSVTSYVRRIHTVCNQSWERGYHCIGHSRHLHGLPTLKRWEQLRSSPYHTMFQEPLHSRVLVNFSSSFKNTKMDKLLS